MALVALAFAVVGLLGVCVLLWFRVKAAENQIVFLERRIRFREGLHEMLRETDLQEQTPQGRF